MKSFAAIGAAALAIGATQACTTVPDNQVTFYGFPDNSPPGAGVAHNCGGRNNIAGGTGTYADPLTFATAPGEYSPCEILYLPLLKKYVRYEDDCEQCISDFKSGQHHIDIWTGSSTQNGGKNQIDCEDQLTSGGKYTVVRQPPQGLDVDTTALYADGKCNTKNVYESNQASCSADQSGSSSGNSTSTGTGDSGSGSGSGDGYGSGNGGSSASITSGFVTQTTAAPGYAPSSTTEKKGHKGHKGHHDATTTTSAVATTSTAAGGYGGDDSGDDY